MQVQVDVAIILSFVAVLATIINVAFGIRRSRKNDNKDDAKTMANDTAAMATVLADLGYIKKQLDDLGSFRNRVSDEINGMRDRVVVNEQQIKSVWKRLEAIEAVTVNRTAGGT